MTRALPALALVLLLLLPAAQAASPGARAPIAANDDVTDVAIAASGARFAASSQDPSGRFTGGGSVPTWNLWNLDGSLRQSGGADTNGCPTNPDIPLDDCQTDATDLAISADGKRVAVASYVSQSAGSRVFVYDDTGTRRMYVDVDGEVLDLAMDPSGQYVAAGLRVPIMEGPDTQDGRIFLWLADGGSVRADETTEDPATTVDLTGAVLAAGAGTTHYRFHVPNDPAFTNGNIQGSVADVDAAATHSKKWSVAGYSSGYFALFSDAGGSTQSVPDYQKKEGGETTAANAVAIRDDATAFAVGHEGGRLRLYSLDPATQGAATAVGVLNEKSGLGAVHGLAFSADGRYLAVRAGDAVRLYYTGNGLLEEMWSDARSGLGPSVAVDGRGEHVVAWAGTGVIVYDATHRIVPSLPSASQQPGANATYTVSYRNDGNRVEAIDLTAQPPAGVTVGINPAQLVVAPGASKSTQVTVGLPSSWPQGTLSLPVRHSLNGGADGSGTATLAITVPTVHRVLLEADGASKGANGGEPARFDVTVRNAGNVQETVTLRVSGLPSGWTADIEPNGVPLAAGTSSAVRVELQPPAGAPDGTRATVTLQRSDGPAPALELTATVGASFAVRLTAPAGLTLNPGVAGLLNLTVQNRGNTVDSFTVRINALPAGWLGGFLNGQGELDVEDLDPDASRTVQFSLRPPEDFASSVPVQVTFTAASHGDASKTSMARPLVTVEPPRSPTTTTGDGDGNGIPAPGPLLALAALALAAAAARRRA